MAGIGGPNTITDGLILSLDAANIKSFKGEPTVNILSSPINMSNGRVGAASAGVTYTDFTSGGFNNSPFYRVTRTVSTPPSTGWDFQILNPNPGYANGTLHTFSFYARSVDGSTSTIKMSNPDVEGQIFNLTTEWKRYEATFTLGAQIGGYLYLRINRNNQSLVIGSNYDLCMGQIEYKPYATPFVNGTRGTTVATGGGWADKSGNNNHAELINGPTFNSGNGGSIVFDGVDDYVQASLTSINLDSACTIEGVLKRNSTPTAWRTFFNIKPSSTNIPFFEFRSNGNAEHIFADYYNGADSTTTSAPFPTGTFGHAVATYDGVGSIKMYFNGELIGIKTGVPSFAIGASPRLTVGRAYTDNRNTDIEAPLIKIYNRALTSPEVLQNYNATKNRFK